MKPNTKQHGFTLIELIIVSIIVGIMAAVLSPLMLSSLTAYNKIQDNVVVLDKLRYATERMAREIREVQYARSTTTPTTDCGDTPATTDHFCITTMGTSGLTFRRSYTDNSTGTISWRNVSIGSANSTVTLAYSDINSGTPQVLTDELGSTGYLAFAYYQQDGTTPAILAGNINCVVSTTCVRYVQIELKLIHNDQPYIQRTRVSLRNFTS
jgi:prepilin-type N-terminal cleavage/methylation domain-containing protein